jgi:predicted nucleic acid-binding protein
VRVLVDTSVWVDLINGHESPEAAALADLLAGEDDICTCGVVVAEVLQGLRRPRGYARVRDGFADLTFLEPSGMALYVRAAEIFRALRKRGQTVRSTIDCVIAAIAEEHRCHLLARDRDLREIAASGVVDLPSWPAG